MPVMSNFSVRNASHQLIALQVRQVDRYCPRRLLLLSLGMLDRLDRLLPRRVKCSVADGMVRVPEGIRASLIAAADDLVPDDVDNSWKYCSILAGIGKYIPERAIPMRSAARWERLRFRYHIPTLIEGTQPRGPSLN